MAFPSFSAGDESWTVACDGQGLMIRGNVRRSGSTTVEQVNSLIPLAAVSSFHMTRDAGAAKVTLRIWDGPDQSFGVVHGGSTQIIGGLQALAAEVARMNATWPLSTSRAAFARQQVPAGYLRDSSLLGKQGKEEFWSPLSELPWTWANAWQKSGHSSTWPLAAIPAPLGLIVLTADAVVVVQEDASFAEIPYSALDVPRVITRQTSVASHATLEVLPDLGLEVQAIGQEPIALLGLTGQQVQPAYRYLLARWAENYTSRFDNPVDAAVAAAEALNEGALSAVEYAMVLDAIVAQASNVALSREYPPREREYLRAEPRPAAAPPRPAATTHAAGPRPTRQGVNPRQVAAGAAAGATLWSFFSD